GDRRSGQNPAAERDHAAGEVLDREHQPLAEAIEDAPVVAAAEQPGGDRVLDRVVLGAQVAHEHLATTGSEPEPEPCDRLRGDPALGQVCATSGALRAGELMAEV